MLAARERGDREDPKGVAFVKRVLVGRPLATTEMEHQRIPKTIALAVFSSDAISSTAYATEEILFVVATGASSLALGLSVLVPIGIAVAVLLAIVVTSYRQTIFAYPSGGGSYVVSRENLGENPSLDRGRVAARRLHPHRRGVDLRGRRRDRVDPRVPRPREAPRAARPRADRVHQPRQPARHQGVRSHVRRADLRLHLRVRSRSSCYGLYRTLDRQRHLARSTARRLRRQRHRRDARACSSCSRGSRRARSRSPVSRRSRTACPRSADPSRRTRRTRWCGWA